MRVLAADLHVLEERLRGGGGAKKVEKQHRDGKLTARERIAGLLDPHQPFLEIGLLIAYDKYDGQAPAAGVVTGLGRSKAGPPLLWRTTPLSKLAHGGPKRSRKSCARRKSPCAIAFRSSISSIPPA